MCDDKGAPALIRTAQCRASEGASEDVNQRARYHESGRSSAAEKQEQNERTVTCSGVTGDDTPTCTNNQEGASTKRAGSRRRSFKPALDRRISTWTKMISCGVIEDK